MYTLETMLLKIKINIIVDLPKKVFIWTYESLLFEKDNTVTFIVDYAWKKYSNAFILQKILHRMTQWVTGTQNAI